MKKNLIKSTTFVFILVLVLNTVVAGTKGSYYAHMLNSWGLAVGSFKNGGEDLSFSSKGDIVSFLRIAVSNSYVSVSGIDNADVLVSYIQKKYGSFSFSDIGKLPRYTLILSSQLSSAPEPSLEAGSKPEADPGSSPESSSPPSSFFETTDNSNTILICDVPYTSNAGFSCGYDYISDPPPGVSTDTHHSSGGVPLFLRVKDEDFYIIPEQSFVVVSYYRELSNYFEGVQRMEYQEILIEKNKDGPTVVERLRNLDSGLTKLFVETLSVFTLAALFWGALRALIKSPKALLEKKTYGLLWEKVSSFLFSCSKISTFVLVILVTVFIVLIVLLSYSDTGTLDIGYITSYERDALEVSSLADFVKEGNLFKAFFSFYNFLILIFFFLTLLPYFLSLSVHILRRVGSKKVSRRILKPAIFLLLFTQIFLGTSFSLESSHLLIIEFTILLGIFMYYFSRGDRTHFEFSPRQRLGLLVGLVIVVSVSLGVGYFRGARPVQYSLEPLIGVKDDIVLLPYYKQWGKHVLFEDLPIDSQTSIYVDEYLIHYPGYDTVVNTNIKNFNGEGDFIILSSGEGSVLRGLLASNTLLEELKSSEVSRFFVSDWYNKCSDAECYAKIVLDCSSDIDPVSINLKLWYYHNVYEEYRTPELELLKFPGCSEAGRGNGGVSGEIAENSLHTYTVPLTVGRINTQNIIGELRGVDSKNLKNFEVWSGEKQHSIEFVDFGSGSKILKNRADGRGDVLHSYSLERISDVSFKVENAPEINLSERINYLLQEGLLSNPFEIWSSTNENAVIQNKFKEK